MAKQNKPKPGDDANKTEDEKDIVVVDKKKITAAAETKPDQSVINQPAPNKGVGLLASWKAANK